MKKLLITAAMIVCSTATTAVAEKICEHDPKKGYSVCRDIEDLSLEKVVFGRNPNEYITQGSIVLRVKNNTKNEIVAWKATVVCKDAFNEPVLRLSVVSRSANIKPGQTVGGTWMPNMFSDESDLLLNNTAKNFTCSLENTKIVQK